MSIKNISQSLASVKDASTLIQSDYRRATEWMTLPTVTASDEKVVGLCAVTPGLSNFIAFTASGNYTIDWGDGTVENFNGTAVAYHNYDYDALTVDTSTVKTTLFRGYKQVIFTITPQSGQQLTNVNFNIIHNNSTLSANTSTNILELSMSLPNCTLLQVGYNLGVSSFVKHNYLEIISIYKTGNLSNLTYLFYQLLALRYLPICNLTSTQNSVAYMFGNCKNLIEAPLFNTSTVVTFDRMFDTCVSLLRVPLYNTVAGTSFSYMFSTCNSLNTIPVFNMINAVYLNYMFQSCKNLVKFPKINLSNVSNMVNCFSGCGALTTFNCSNFASLSVSGCNISNTFSSCTSLLKIPSDIDYSKAVTCDSTFLSCTSLVTVPKLNLSKSSSCANMFNGCSSLIYVDTITLNPTNSVIATSMFIGCNILEYVEDMVNSNKISSYSNLFSSCNQLVRFPALNLTNGLSSSGVTSNMYNISKFDAYNIKFSFTVANNKLSASELNKIYGNLATTTGQTITVTNNYGTAGDDPTIATSRGWVVTG